MEYNQFLQEIITLGIDAAKRDYTKKDHKDLLAGSIAGFEACSDKTPLELKVLLESSSQDAYRAMLEDKEHYWYFRGFANEVEWVCNVVSAMQYNQKMQTIVTPTARGIMTAAKILGVATPLSTKTQGEQEGREG